jgi:hypothetical protein
MTEEVISWLHKHTALGRLSLAEVYAAFARVEADAPFELVVKEKAGNAKQPSKGRP